MSNKIIDAILIGCVAWLFVVSYVTYKNVQIMKDQIEIIIDETNLNEIMAD